MGLILILIVVHGYFLLLTIAISLESKALSRRIIFLFVIVSFLLPLILLLVIFLCVMRGATVAGTSAWRFNKGACGVCVRSRSCLL